MQICNFSTGRCPLRNKTDTAQYRWLCELCYGFLSIFWGLRLQEYFIMKLENEDNKTAADKFLEISDFQ